MVFVRRSETTLFTSRETNGHENATVALTHRAGLARQFGSGLYALTPTGERIRQQLIAQVTREMDRIGGQRINLPGLNGSDVWKQSGRWNRFEGEMFTLENRDGRQLCLAPSHEEGAVHLLDGVVRSYEDLPCLFYQVESKHRDDHARNGLLRLKEFTMKDAYSFHASRDSLEQTYDAVRDAYVRLFERLDIEFAITEAANSVMGGATSEEFVALADAGTVEVLSCTTDGCRFGLTEESPSLGRSDTDTCPECGGTLESGEGIEIGHIFQLGTRYSAAMGLSIDTADGGECDVVMGSYGIGIERLIHTLVEQHSDERGCRWPSAVAPYTAAIVPLEYEDELRAAADRLYEQCHSQQTLLFDDESQHIGERFAESDLLGIPHKIVLGTHFLETGMVELESRDGHTQYVEPEEVSTLVESPSE